MILNSYRKNKKFIYSFLIGLALSILLLFSINIFSLQSNKKSIYNNSIISFEENDENKFESSLSYNYITGPAKHLSFEEAKTEINYDLFSKIMDITVKYNVNNILDYQRYHSVNEPYTQFTRQELENDFLNNCSVIQSEEYGKFFQLHGKYNFYIKFSYDGKTIDYNRYFNYGIRDDFSLDLSDENLNSKFEIAKNFLDDYSFGLSSRFNPDTSFINDSGTVYVWEDNTNNISFSYNLLYDCPCGFHTNFNTTVTSNP